MSDNGQGYFDWRSFLKLLHCPDGARGCYARTSQSKRRKMARRAGYGRRKRK